MEVVFDIPNLIDRKLIKLVQYILENPSFHIGNNKSYPVHEILDLPTHFEISSEHLFAIMSSAFSPGREERKNFLSKHPETEKYLSTLGPNRVQYTMILFEMIRQFDPLVEQIIQHCIVKAVDKGEFGKIYDTYEYYEEFRVRKSIFLASPEFLKAKIILLDKDPNIQKLKYNSENY